MEGVAKENTKEKSSLTFWHRLKEKGPPLFFTKKRTENYVTILFNTNLIKCLCWLYHHCIFDFKNDLYINTYMTIVKKNTYMMNIYRVNVELNNFPPMTQIVNNRIS